MGTDGNGSSRKTRKLDVRMKDGQVTSDGPSEHRLTGHNRSGLSMALSAHTGGRRGMSTLCSFIIGGVSEGRDIWLQ